MTTRQQNQPEKGSNLSAPLSESDVLRPAGQPSRQERAGQREDGINIEKIRIADRGSVVPGSREVWVLRVGPFGVRANAECWSITHLRSGTYLKNDCCCVIGAVGLANQLAVMWDWNRDAPELVADPLARTITGAMRQWRCPACHPSASDSNPHRIDGLAGDVHPWQSPVVEGENASSLQPELGGRGQCS